MNWFEGGIPAAIQTARQNNAVFIVFISGESYFILEFLHMTEFKLLSTKNYKLKGELF